MSIAANIHSATRMSPGERGETSWLEIHDDKGNHFTVFMPFEVAEEIAHTFNTEMDRLTVRGAA